MGSRKHRLRKGRRFPPQACLKVGQLSSGSIMVSNIWIRYLGTIMADCVSTASLFGARSGPGLVGPRFHQARTWADGQIIDL